MFPQPTAQIMYHSILYSIDTNTIMSNITIFYFDLISSI